MGVAPKGPPYHVFSQQTFPQGLLRRGPWVAEVGDTASILRRKAASVVPSKAAERPAETKLSIEHVYVTVCVYEPNLTARVVGPKRCSSHGSSSFRTVTMCQGVTHEEA